MYLARDKNNDLYLFNELPQRGNECWWASTGVDGTYLRLDSSLYPEVTWDSEPLEVEITDVIHYGGLPLTVNLTAGCRE